MPYQYLPRRVQFIFGAHIAAFDGEGGSERQTESIWLDGKFVGGAAGSRSGCSENYVASMLQNATQF
jgi:hypothetical protein